MSVPIHAADPEMETAISEAKQSIGRFFEAFANPTHDQHSFLVKIAFDIGDSYEHIWLADLDFTGDKPRGVVANEPETNLLHFMQVIEFEPMYISDWMFVDSGNLIGGFSTKLLRSRMSHEDRAKFNSSLPYTIG